MFRDHASDGVLGPHAQCTVHADRRVSYSLRQVNSPLTEVYDVCFEFQKLGGWFVIGNM